MRNLWTIAIGAAAGFAAGAASYLIARRSRPVSQAEAWPAGRALDGRVARALAGDPELRVRPIEVGLLSDGIIELTGTVDDDDEAHRAVEIAQEVPGVRTVLNRLDVGEIEERLATNRQRYEQGDAGMHETRWYGMGVGTGRRRQSRETDPDRPDEKVPMQADALGTDRALEDMSEDIEKLAPGGEQHTSANAAPTDRYSVDDAPHRRLGNPPEDVQDLNPEAGVHENIKKGTEVTLEESGMERELERGRRGERQERG